MKQKKYLYTNLIILGIGIIIILSIVFTNKKADKLVYGNGQIGLITTSKEIIIDDNVIQPYSTTSQNIYLCFESFNMSEDYDNEIIINDKHHLLIKPSSNKQNDYLKNKIALLGLNIIDGKLKIKFKAGKNFQGRIDTFWIRNIYLEIGSKKIIAKEDQSLTYSRVVRLGNSDLKSHLREDYREEELFNFEIEQKLLKEKGTLIDNNSNTIVIKKTNKEIELDNPAFLSITVNVQNEEEIKADKQIDVVFSEGVSNYKLLLNGVEINNHLKLTKEAWAIGNNKLEVIAQNKYGFMKKDTINFYLNDYLTTNNLIFQAYDNGIDKLNERVKLGNEIADVNGYYSSFAEDSQINFVIKDSENKNIVWKGKTLPNRTIYLQIFNHLTNSWETKSSMFNNDEIVTLGYNYSTDRDVVKNNEVNVRVVASNLTKTPLIDKYIYHVTDVQYISRNGSLEITSVANNAKSALNEMAVHMIDLFEEDMLEYVVMTGDYVQSTVVSGDKEWPIVMDYLITPLLNEDIPFGTVSGNHDVAALNENPNRLSNEEGINLFDEDLLYDLYYANLGEDVFKDKTYYGESFENNRSHFDLVEINNHEFLFLYLGWGSSIRGIHVSEKDIVFAKDVLERFPNKTVVIGVHEYMGNKENKSTTGNYLYEKIVKPYKNVKFVLSGHINGSSANIDYFDDNKDGIYDRRVLQLLTNFQEEAIDNLGATFIRRLGLDFTNERINFDIYSPIANDYQIFVGSNPDYVKRYTNFNYDFDLNNNGYGLLTISFGS